MNCLPTCLRLPDEKGNNEPYWSALKLSGARVCGDLVMSSSNMNGPEEKTRSLSACMKKLGCLMNSVAQ